MISIFIIYFNKHLSETQKGENMQIMKKILVLFVAFFLGTNFAYSKCKDPKQLRFSIIPTEESSFELDLYRPVFKK